MWKRVVNVAVFLALITVLGGYNLIAEGKPSTSEIENRELADAPVFSFGALVSGAFFRDFDTFYSDNFVFREAMVLANAQIADAWRISPPGDGADVQIIYDTDGGDYDHGMESPIDSSSAVAASTVLLTDDAIASGAQTTELGGVAAASAPTVSAAPDAGAPTPTKGASPSSLPAATPKDNLPPASPAAAENYLKTAGVPAAATRSPSPSGSAAVTAGSVSATSDSTISVDSAAHADSGDQTEPIASAPTARKVGGIIIQGNTMMEMYGFYAPACDRYAEIINKYAEAVSSKSGDSVRVISLLAPTSAAFNLDDDYKKLSSSQDQAAQYIYDKMRDDVTKVDAYTEMSSHRGEYMHFRTDHHWTQLGAYYAYVAFAKMIGAEPIDLELCKNGVADSFLGALYGKNPSSIFKNNRDEVRWYEPPVKTRLSIFDGSGKYERDGKVIDLSYENVGNKYQVFLGGDAPYARIDTDVENSMSAVVVKDSYGLAFIPWLTSHYETIHVVDPRYYEGGVVSLARTEDVDDLIFVNSMHMSGAKSYADSLIGRLK